MHKNFGEWYRLVSIEPNEDLLKKRWAGVAEWTSTLRVDDDAILETVRIFQGLPEKTSRDRFFEAFRKHDAAFPQRNELEQRVLAGAALVACVRAKGDDEDKDDGIHAAIIAGTAVEASSLLASDSRLSEVAEEILAGLRVIARAQRERVDLHADGIGTKADAAAKELKQIPEVTTWDEFKISLAPVLESIVEALRGFQTALAAAEQNVRCSEEETNILWWLEGACSRDLNKQWSALPKDAVPLIAGAELADLTNIALGPQDAAAFLDRVVTGVKAKEGSMHSYVNAVPEEWLKARRDAVRGLDLAPLSLALSHRRQGSTSSWTEFFEASSGMNASTSLDPGRVARHAYVEAVLLHTLADAED